MINSSKICPLCAHPNDCGAEAIKSCWCNSTAVPQELQKLIPRNTQNKACICRNCIKEFQNNPNQFCQALRNQSPRHTMIVKAEEKDIDLIGHVNNTVYLRWTQEVATAHWYQLTNQAEKENILWVVRKHEIEYKKESLLGDNLYLTTWVEEMNRLLCHRRTDICHSNGELAAKVLTIWCPIDSKSHKIIRPSKETREKLLR